jgi:hypothetical protein
MVEFFTNPVFFLTPWIVLWAVLTGVLAGLVAAWLFRPLTRTMTWLVAVATFGAIILWNWSIEFNRSTIYLNVDHPLLRVSWADIIDGLCVLALTALVLGLGPGRQEPAHRIIGIATLSAIITVLTDTFCF